jgi:hypothetical protein
MLSVVQRKIAGCGRGWVRWDLKKSLPAKRNERWRTGFRWASAVLLLLSAGLIPGAARAHADEQPASKLRIEVTGVDANMSKPVANASVYLRWDEESGILHRKKEIELNFKTDQEGIVKVPEVPRRKILIQIVAPGWHTYGRYYDIAKDEEIIQIKLEKPPRWY